ncbi:MAG TPA: hypothetical protein VFR15_07625, partial [Chloroflexia bacterium]|nr:hypothetical protein [Chloroflexia bacterium]
TGAAAAVLVAMFLPLPRAVLSEEEQAAGRMPATRQQVDQARAEFERVQAAYRTHVSQNDVGASLAAFEDAVADLERNSGSPETVRATETAAAPLLSFLERLQAYAEAGETYFQALRYYDDELMAWTRSLGAESEVLRSATWPIVEYLKLYPPPVGLDDDYTWTGAADVMTTSVTLQRNLTTGDPAALRSDSSAIREAGRNVEKIESLHPQYERLLREYDEELQAVIAARGASEPDARRTLATVLDVSVALLLVLGIAGLLLPRRPAPGSAS